MKTLASKKYRFRPAAWEGIYRHVKIFEVRVFGNPLPDFAIKCKAINLEAGVYERSRRPLDFVSTLIGTTVNGFGIFTAFEFRDYDTEVILISAHWTDRVKYLTMIPA